MAQAPGTEYRFAKPQSKPVGAATASEVLHVDGTLAVWISPWVCFSSGRVGALVPCNCLVTRIPCMRLSHVHAHT